MAKPLTQPPGPSNAIEWTDWVVPNGGIDESKSDHDLPPEKWASAFDVEPLPAGCRARNGKYFVNTYPLGAVIVSNETGVNSRQFSDGTADYISQGFTLPRDVTLRAVSVCLATRTGTPTSAIQFAIYSNAAGQPGTAVTSGDFGDFSTVAAATINAKVIAAYYQFLPTSALGLNASTTYHFVLKSTGGSGANNYSVFESAAGDPYANGTLNFSTNGTAWTTVALADLLFRIYVTGTNVLDQVSIAGILDYKLSDASTERLLVVAGGEVFKEVSGAMTLVSGELGTFLMSNDPDVHPAMNVGSDIAFISDGVNTPRKYYIRSGLEYMRMDGIAPPTATPTVAIGAGGSLAVGDWYVDYYYWNDILGTKSNTRYQGALSLKATTTGGNQTINLSNLPADKARGVDHVTHIRISLKSPSGSIFRFAGTAQGQVALFTTTASITTDATTTEPDYDDDIAPIHSIATVGANQRFIAGIAATPYRVMASKINITAPYYESFPALNYRDFGRGDGDYVTALAFIPPATLVVGMKNSVWALDARQFLTADPVLISKNVGIAGKNAFMVVGRALFFVSDSDRTKGMMLWDGSQVLPLTAIDKTFKTLVPARLKYATCGHLAPGDNRFQWWTLLTASGTSQNRVLVYDYALDAWTVYRHSGNILGSATKLGGISKLKIGGTDGTLYDADTGSEDAAATIVGTFTAKRYDFGAPDAPKRVRFLRAEGDGSTDSSLSVNFEPDIQGFPSFSAALDFSGSTASFLGSGVLGTFVLGSGAGVISTRVGITGVCRNAQPTFYSSSRWSLRGYALGVQLLRRRA